ncbi:hypothetical protein [Endozoicomonas sp. 4G]|uniref:hypothetical protein n=1 Tax=Endozoicomonas sp. 4G TaxID=2872754 RepID=UPI002078FED8|nr:hypothetical protein [Endozoicomonas sp. 4G]
MLSKKPVILTLSIAFSVHCSHGLAEEIRVLPDDELKIGLYSPGVKTILLLPLSEAAGSEEENGTIEWWELKQEPEANDSDRSEVCFGDDILLKSGTRYCFSPATGVFPATGVEAKGYRRAASDGSADSEDSGNEDSSASDENSDNRSDETDAESAVQYVTTTLNPFSVPGEISPYCRALELNKIKQEPVSDSEITTESEVDPTEADSVKHPEITSPANSTDQIGHLKRHKQTHLPADQRPRKPKMHHCDHEGCNYRTDHTGHLKMHKQKHLPADQKLKKLKRPKKTKVHPCDYQGCGFSTGHMTHLKMHKKTHLPADQRPKRLEHHCDHESCNYSTSHTSHMKRHKQIHLPADQRLKVQCDHEGCNYGTHQASNLKKHKWTHLPVDQRPKRPKRKANSQPPSDEKRKKGGEE